MAKYIDADKTVGLMFFDDTCGREKNIVETDTIENILDRFTKEGCPEEADVIPRDEAIKIFKYLEPPRFDLNCWGRLEKSAEHDIWEIYFKRLQNLGKVNVEEKSMSYFPCDIPFMTADELIENNIHTPKDVSSTNIENTGFISIREALDAVEESRRLNRHKDAKKACAHEYEHRHFLKILMDIQPADVAPVVHGEWLPIVSYDNIYKCSECGRLLKTINGKNMVAKHYPYCHCGAKMDSDFCSRGKRKE